MKDTYTHKQEIWDEKTCAKKARYNSKNAYGDKNPWPGLIASSSSTYPQYGQTVRYNGGFIAPDGEHYQSESVPSPIIHENYEFIHRLSWGIYIQKKSLAK